MSKLKNIAVFSAMLVGVMIYTSPAKSAVCFLPDDDGSCGGGDIEISDNNSNQDQCTDFKLSKNQRDSKEYSSDCYTCESCTYNNRTTYKCSPKSGATWYGGNIGICCTNGETYNSAEGQCCPAGGCTHECDAPKEWSSTLRSCECPADREENDNHECCPVGEHADGTICCPDKKHNENGKCVCDSQYNTDDKGNCVPQSVSKPTINIAFEQKTNSLGVGNDGDEYYYKTLKFFSASSDNEYRKVQLRTYPATACGSKYTLKPPVTIDSDEYAHTFFSHCEKDTQIGASSVIKIETLVDNEVAYTYIPVKDNVKGIDFNELTKLQQPIDTGKYYLKYTAGKACKDINSNYVNDEEEDYQECHIRTGHEDVDQEMFSTTYTGVAGIDGKCLDCHWMTCKEAGYVRDVSECPDATKYELYKLDDYIGSDGQCYECITKDFTIEVKTSDCYGVYIKDKGEYETTINGSKKHYYLLPKNTEVKLGVWPLSNSRLCKNADYSLYINGRRFFSKNNEFTLNDEFIQKYNIDRNEFIIRTGDEINKITYNVALNVEHDSKPSGGFEASMFDIYADMDNASNDTFMDGTLFTCYLTLTNNTGDFGVPFPGYLSFDGGNHTIIKDNLEDNTGWCSSAYIVEKDSWCEIYFRKKSIRKYLDKFNCVQLGENSDNTEVCLNIDNNHSDSTSNNCGTFW